MFEILSQEFFSFILGFAPVSEIRGAAIYAFGMKNPDLILFGLLGNIAAALCLLLFWDLVHIEKIGLRIVGKKIAGMIESYHKNHELGETIALAIFIGIPLPGTGVYSGILLGKILKISDKKIIVASISGILIAALIMYLVLSGTASFLSFLAFLGR